MPELDKEFEDAWDDDDTAQDSTPSNDEDKDDFEETEDDRETQDHSDDDSADHSVFNTDTNSDDPSDEDKSEDKVDYQELYEQSKSELQKEQQRTRTWEGRISKANQRAKEAEDRLKELSNKEPNSDPIVDDEGTLDPATFAKEFPDLVGPINKMIEDKVNEAVAAITKEYKPTQERVEQLAATTQEDRVKKHFADIREGCKHFDEIVSSKALHTWVAKQPEYLQVGMNQVLDAGSANEIVNLFNDFIRVTKWEPKLKTNTKTTPPQTKTSSKLSSMMAVPGQSPGPPASAPSSDDFDSAWDEAVDTDK